MICTLFAELFNNLWSPHTVTVRRDFIPALWQCVEIMSLHCYSAERLYQTMSRISPHWKSAMRSSLPNVTVHNVIFRAQRGTWFHQKSRPNNLRLLSYNTVKVQWLKQPKNRMKSPSIVTVRGRLFMHTVTAQGDFWPFFMLTKIHETTFLNEVKIK